MAMGTVAATRSKRLSSGEFRRLLDQALTEVNSDERSGPLLRATGIRLRFEFPDLKLVLNVAPGEDADAHLRWEFADDVDWDPRLRLTMDSEVANAYLQGKESLAIAIARQRVRCSGETRCALVYVPAMRLLVEAYKRVIRDEHPDLAVA